MFLKIEFLPHTYHGFLRRWTNKQGRNYLREKMYKIYKTPMFIVNLKYMFEKWTVSSSISIVFLLSCIHKPGLF